MRYDDTFYKLFYDAKDEDDYDKYIHEHLDNGEYMDRMNDLPTIYQMAHVTPVMIRKSLGMTQEEFAKWCFCSKRGVENWEENGTCSDGMRVSMAIRAGMFKDA